MALTALTQTLTDMYLLNRPGIAEVNGYPVPTTVYNALVSDLQAGDWLVGSRQLVVGTGATTGTLRAITLRRHNAVDVTVNWVAASPVRIAR